MFKWLFGGALLSVTLFGISIHKFEFHIHLGAPEKTAVVVPPQEAARTQLKKPKLVEKRFATEDDARRACGNSGVSQDWGNSQGKFDSKYPYYCHLPVPLTDTPPASGYVSVPLTDR